MRAPRSKPASFAEILLLFPSLRAVSRGLDVGYETVVAWRRRNYVPSNYHPGLVELAEVMGIRGITLEGMRVLAAERLAVRLAAVQARRERARPAPSSSERRSA